MTDTDGIPQELKDREQWLLWSNESEPPKAPQTPEGYNASWTDPAAWMGYEEATDALSSDDYFDGIGFVIAEKDPYIGLDLDGILQAPNEEKPKKWVPGLGFIAGTWAEYSGSGHGIHVIVEGDTLPNWWSDSHFSDEEHEGVEAYTEKFFALTGNRVEFSTDKINHIDVEPFLSAAYEAINGEPPQLPGSESEPDSDVDVTIYDVIGAGSYPEGENTGHPFHPSETGTNFRVDEGGETFRCWRHGVTGNALHLLGIEQDVINCGGWASGGLNDDTWREIFDAGRNAGYDIPNPETEARESSESGGGTDGRWNRVHRLYELDESGTTTKANTIAADLIDDTHEIVPIRDTGVIYIYDENAGYYVRKGERYLDQIIQSKLGEKWNINRARNVRKNVIARNWVSEDEFTPPQGKVCVQTGVLDLETREIEPHSPDYYFTSQLNVEYDPDAETELWEEFLHDVVPVPGDAKKIEEFIGYTLQVWHHKRHKNMFIVGPTQSGKSTLADVVKEMYGSPPTVVNLTPQQIADTRFDAASLKDAMLNTVNDINASKIENSGALKRVLAGEPLKLENKHKDASFGAPKAKHLFTANWLPPIVGQDEAIWRRLLIVEFPDTVPNEKRDEDLPAKLKEELPGILNRALDGLDRLKKQNNFTNDRSREKTQQLWDSWRDAHKRFLYDTFEITGDSDDTVEKDTYYQAYKEHAATNGFEIKPKQSVTKSLKYVAEIEVGDDYYAGIDWENNSGESVNQNRLQTQSKLRSTVLEWVNEFETPLSGASKQQIRQYAKDQSADVERVMNVIDNLLNDGTLYDSGDGIRIT